MVYGEVADSIQGRPEALSRRPRFTSDAEWSAYGERVTAFARHTLARGVRLAYHHHMGAYVETAEDVDHLMRVTGPEVGLLHDTGHVTFAGGDAPTELKKHIARVCHVHCKDVRPAVARMARNRGWSFLDSVLNGAFSTPGEGCVDFAAVIAHPARRGLPRLARRRGRAGSGRRARVSLRRDGLSSAVGARGREVRCRGARRGDDAGGRRHERCAEAVASEAVHELDLLVKAARTGRTIARVTPQSAGWRYVGFEALWLAPGET